MQGKGYVFRGGGGMHVSWKGYQNRDELGKRVSKSLWSRVVAAWLYV